MPPLTNHDQLFRVQGSLDSVRVQSILATIDALPANVRVVVDVSDAKRVEDVAVASLIAGLGDRRFRLRGLSVHHQRLLRYLGLPARVDTDRVPVPARRTG